MGSDVKIPLGVVEITPRQIELVNQVLMSQRLSYGSITRAFEAKLAEIHQVKHAIFMASGTCALQVLLKAAKELHGWYDRSEVIIPATTFIATMSAVRDAGLTPVLCDVEPETYNLCPQAIKRHLGPHTRAFLPVHLLGRPPKVDWSLTDMPTFADCCEAFGATTYAPSVISTYICHHMTTGVGGAVLTSSDSLAEIVRSLMQHGRDPAYPQMEDDDGLDHAEMRKMMKARYSFVRWGHSYRSTEMEAALGLGALDNWEEQKLARLAIAGSIRNALLRWRQIKPQFFSDDSNPLFYPFELDTPQNCQGLAEAFEAVGIETRPMMPLLTQPIVQREIEKRGGSCWKDYPVATRLCHSAFLIGCHPGISVQDIHLIRDTVDSYFKGLT